MSWETYDDVCPGCKPVLFDPATGHVFGDDHPDMQALAKLWEETTLEERRAFHNVCCKNSRQISDLEIVEQLAERFRAMPR